MRLLTPGRALVAAAALLAACDGPPADPPQANVAPHFVGVPPATAIEDTPWEYVAAVDDPDGPEAHWETLPTHTCGALFGDAGWIKHTPLGPVPPPTCHVAVRFCDGGTPDLCATQEADVAITPVNDDPRIVPQAPLTATEDTPLEYQPVADDPDGPEQHWSLTTADTCAGSLDPATGAYRFTPAGPTPPAMCRIGLQLCDGGAPDLCASMTVTVTIDAVDDPAIAFDDDATARRTGPTRLDVLTNDVDADGGALAIGAVTQPASGAVAIDGANVVYTPAPGSCTGPGDPPDTFTYTLAPGGSTATVRVRVACPAPPIARMSAGANHTCEVRTDGSLWCWGQNTDGQLGDGTIDERRQPTRAGAANNWATVAAGQDHTCALRTDGTLWCWGKNDGTQLGDGTTIGRRVPTQIGAGATWESVTAGDTHTCAIRTDGTLWCWGWNLEGQVGDGTHGPTMYRSMPVQVGTDATWAMVSAGYLRTCAVRSAGSLWCWGDLSAGGLNPIHDVPVRIGAASTWTSVAVGYQHQCGTRLDGTAWCWGSDVDGQLGDGLFGGPTAAPAQVGTATSWSSIVTGRTHTCGTRTDGTLWCWGHNGGELGDGTSTQRSVPTRVGLASDWSAVTAGWYHTCGVRQGGTRWCWGSNTYGQHGLGGTQDSATPVLVSAGPWSAVAGGDGHSCAIKGDGSLWCWGFNGWGELGDDSIDAQPLPVAITPGARWTAVAATYAHTCATAIDGSLWCWGRNDAAQLGDGTTVERHYPRQVGTDTTWAQPGASAQFSCATKADSTMRCWGYNTSGQLGDSTLTWRTTPQVVAGAGYARFATGAAHACAIRNDASLWCWGENGAGQLGTGGVDDLLVPTAIAPGTTWTRVATGAAHTCAIATGGGLWCWGANARGQVGNDMVVTQPVPVRIGAATWSAVAAGDDRTCGIQTGGSLWCWGLTLPSTGADYRAAPTRVGTGSDWASVVVGSHRACALRTDGSLWCWGHGGAGGLGDGGVWRNRPAQLP